MLLAAADLEAVALPVMQLRQLAKGEVSGYASAAPGSCASGGRRNRLLGRPGGFRVIPGRALSRLPRRNGPLLTRPAGRPGALALVPGPEAPDAARRSCGAPAARGRGTSAVRMPRATWCSPPAGPAPGTSTLPLNALGRIGRSSLPKKVAHRAWIVESKLGSRFPHLGAVAKVAVKLRNYFVHGGDEIDYPKVEPYLAFSH